jgi:hypothetical protein
MVDAHSIESMQEYDVCLAAVVNEGLMQLLAYFISIYNHRVNVWDTLQIYVPRIEC